MKNILIYTDGASRGNPGLSGVGFIVYDEHHKKIMEGSKFIGTKTNNAAEYEALLLSLESIKNKGIKHISFFSDSELMVRQIKGEYKVSNKNIKPYYTQFLHKIKPYTYDITHITRDKNKVADKLANLAIDLSKNQ